MKKRHLFLCTFVIIFITTSINAQITIAPTVPFSNTQYHISTHVADMDNNGMDDIVSGIKDAISVAKITIQYQVSPGTFAPPVIRMYKIDDYLQEIAVGDINNDQKNDIAFVSGDTLTVITLVDTGFTRKNYYSGTTASEIVISDLNNDGKNDIVVSHWSSPWISVFLQNQQGFIKNTYPVISSGYNDIAVGDINNDGKNDIVFTNGQGFGPYMLYLLQNTTGFDNYKILYSPLGGPNGITIDDVNSDGKVDLIATYGNHLPYPNIMIWEQGLNGLNTGYTLSGHSGTASPKMIDLNCDGKKELVILHSGWTTYSVFESNNNYKFSTYKIFNTTYGQYSNSSLSFGDINYDGKKDIVFSSNTGMQVGINESISISYSVFDTLTKLKTYQQIDTLSSKNYVNTWVEIKNRTKLTYIDSIIITKIMIINTSCYDTIIRKKTYSCISKIDTIKKTNTCYASVKVEKKENRKNNVTVLQSNVDCELIIYPNPASNFVKLTAEKPIGHIYIYMNDGKLIKTYYSSSNNHIINISDLPGGIYLIQTSKEQCHKKLIISR